MCNANFKEKTESATEPKQVGQDTVHSYDKKVPDKLGIYGQWLATQVKDEKPQRFHQPNDKTEEKPRTPQAPMPQQAEPKPKAFFENEKYLKNDQKTGMVLPVAKENQGN